jgi:transcriptional regulator with XRE-family HTH domain
VTGPLIRTARERARLTQEDLARMVGVTPRTIGNWERGAHVPPAQLMRVRSALGMAENDIDALSGATDNELLLELLSRTHQRRRNRGTLSAPTSQQAVTIDEAVQRVRAVAEEVGANGDEAGRQTLIGIADQLDALLTDAAGVEVGSDQLAEGVHQRVR